MPETICLLCKCQRPHVTLHHEMSRNEPDGHFHVFILSESKFFAIYNGENHFQTRGLVAELHVFEFGGTTFGTLGKFALNVEDFHVKTIGWVLQNHVFDHESRRSALFPCYRLQINDFLSSYNQNLKIDISHPCSKFFAAAKVGLAHYDAVRGGGSHKLCSLCKC